MVPWTAPPFWKALKWNCLLSNESNMLIYLFWYVLKCYKITKHKTNFSEVDRQVYWLPEHLHQRTLKLEMVDLGWVRRGWHRSPHWPGLMAHRPGQAALETFQLVQYDSFSCKILCKCNLHKFFLSIPTSTWMNGDEDI